MIFLVVKKEKIVIKRKDWGWSFVKHISYDFRPIVVELIYFLRFISLLTDNDLNPPTL